MLTGRQHGQCRTSRRALRVIRVGDVLSKSAADALSRSRRAGDAALRTVRGSIHVVEINDDTISNQIYLLTPETSRSRSRRPL